MQEREPVRAFVYMVESPAPGDLFDGRTEGRMLSEAPRLADIRTEYRLATNLKMFDIAIIGQFLQMARESKERALPMLHISAHGNTEGLALTDGCSWNGMNFDIDCAL